MNCNAQRNQLVVLKIMIIDGKEDGCFIIGNDLWAMPSVEFNHSLFFVLSNVGYTMAVMDKIGQ